MKNKKKLAAITAAMALSLCSVANTFTLTAMGADPKEISYDEATLPNWVPKSFDDALSFENQYGKTHIADGIICCVQKKDVNGYTYITEDAGSTYNYSDHILMQNEYVFVMPEEPDQSDSEEFYKYQMYLQNLGLDPDYKDVKSPFLYEVTVYEAPESGTINFNWVTKNKISGSVYETVNLSFEAKDGVVTETDMYGWLPDCMEEFNAFTKANGTVSVHDGYIVYANDVCYDGGYDVFMKQTGTAEVTEVMRYNISQAVIIEAPGGQGHTVILYKPETEGTLQMEWTQAQYWTPDEPLTDPEVKNYKVNADLSINELVSNGSYTKGYSYTIENGSIKFDQFSSNAQISYIISSNSNYNMTCDRKTSVFTPNEDGTYVLTVEEFCEEIISAGASGNGHFHYFYPVLTYYTVHVQNDEISVQENGSHNWYSKEQIKEIVDSCADTELMVCSDVMAEGSENLLNGAYFSYVNGEMPLQNGENSHLKNYITNYYNEYKTESYFCMNVGYLNEAETFMPRVILSDDSLAEVLSEMHTSSAATTDDIMDFYMVRAKNDGELSITVDGFMEFDLEIKNGIFKRSDKIKESVKGDANGDGILSMSDAIMLQKYLLGAGKLVSRDNADLCKDGRINVFDLCQMKTEIVEK